MAYKSFLDEVNLFSIKSQLFPYKVNFSRKRVNLFRLYSQLFSGYLVNFFRMNEFIWALKHPFLNVKMEFHGAPWKMRYFI